MATSVDHPDAPIPMSFPSILRDPRNRFAHLHGLKSGDPPGRAGGGGARVEGKRKALRKENSQFVFNPHVVLPRRSDFEPLLPTKLPTFPTPLPPYLPRLTIVPSPPTPERDSHTAEHGRFMVGLRGARKDLRRRGAFAERVVRVVEAELVGWLELGGRQRPDRPVGPSMGIAVDSPYDHCLGGAIVEVYRTPVQLVWRTEDAMMRYVIHCTARWHNVVSFSKDVPNGERHTTLLRPNVHIPDYSALAFLDTPPPTDAYHSPSIIDTEIETDDSSMYEYDSEVSSSIIDLSSRPGRPRSITSDLPPTDLTDGDLASPEYSSDESAFLNDVDMISDDEPLRDQLGDLSLTDITPQPADLARSLDRMRLQDSERERERERKRRSRSSPSPSPSPVRTRRAPRTSGVDRTPRRSSPVGRGALPELERRRPGRAPVRAKSFWDHVFA